MAEASLDVQLEGLYSRLDAQLKGGQYKKALKSSDDSEYLQSFGIHRCCLQSFHAVCCTYLSAGYAKKMTSVAAVLKLSPGQKDAVACKAVTLIELSRFEEAVEHIDEHAADFKELSFEKVGTRQASMKPFHHGAEAYMLRCLHASAYVALHIAGVMGADVNFPLLQAYSLFRLQKFEEALAAVQQNAEDRAVARLNLQAQLHYRMGGSAEAIRIYHQLFKDHKVSHQRSMSLWSHPSRVLDKQAPGHHMQHTTPHVDCCRCLSAPIKSGNACCRCHHWT